MNRASKFQSKLDQVDCNEWRLITRLTRSKWRMATPAEKDVTTQLNTMASKDCNEHLNSEPRLNHATVSRVAWAHLAHDGMTSAPHEKTQHAPYLGNDHKNAHAAWPPAWLLKLRVKFSHLIMMISPLDDQVIPETAAFPQSFICCSADMWLVVWTTASWT